MPRVTSTPRARWPLPLRAVAERWHALGAGTSSLVIAVRSMLRGLLLFASARPKTALRVLCIIAFDALHRHRTAKPLPSPRRTLLAALLDFGADVNAIFDNKVGCRHDGHTALERLEEAGMGSSVAEYLRRLNDLENRRPLPGGDERQFHQVGLYREAVVRLSLAVVAATADGKRRLDEAIRATYGDADLKILFRIAMQCQIIDDVLDYPQDVSGGLPTFLTAVTPLAQAFELTRLASLGYADDRDLPRSGHLLALRSALFFVSTCAKLAITLGQWRWRSRIATARRGA